MQSFAKMLSPLPPSLLCLRLDPPCVVLTQVLIMLPRLGPAKCVVSGRLGVTIRQAMLQSALVCAAQTPNRVLLTLLTPKPIL